MAKKVIESIGTDATVPIETIGTPTGVSVNTVGTAGSTTYGYRIAALNAAGTTLASSTVTTTTGNAALTTGNFNRVTWNRVVEASSYNVYGRTSGSELLMSTVNGLHFDDTGAITPSGALPGTDTSAYDSTQISIGTAIKLNADGGLGPVPISVGRPQESNVPIPVHLTWAVTFSGDVDWVFFTDNVSANITRRIVMYEYYKKTGVLAWKGFVTLTYPSATNHNIRGFNVTYDVYIKGSVGVTGTAVTGVGSTWTTDKICIGSRIGFGSTDPTQITRWYEISAVGSNTGITLTVAVDATISTGAAYCIEELRIITTTTNATPANGGLFVTKGLRPELFITSGTTIASATTIDNTRAVMWLADASTVTNTTACGSAIEDKTTFSSQFIYVIDGTSSPKVYKYNCRASLTLASGKDTTTLNLTTGIQAVTGTVSQLGNGRIVTASHGAGSGVSSLYYVTTTRVQRAAVSNITNTNTTWNSDSMTEVPPGGVNTYAASAVMNTIDYVPGIDRFVILTPGISSYRHYVTQYQTGGSNFDSIFGIDARNFDQTLAYPDISPPFPSSSAQSNTALSSYSLYNTTYIVKINTGLNLNNIYTTSFGSDYTFAQISGNDQSIITPSMATTGCVLFNRVSVNSLKNYGSNQYNHLPAEPYKIWYRTSGISDNSGGWTVVPDGGNLTTVTAANAIQFRIKFKTIGNSGLTTRTYSVAVMYEDSSDLPSHLKWNLDDTDNNGGTVGFVQMSYYGSVPNLQVDYYRSDTDANVLSQASTGTTNGAFEYWDGSSWTTGLNTDTPGLRRRFRVIGSLPTGVNVYARIKVI